MKAKKASRGESAAKRVIKKPTAKKSAAKPGSAAGVAEYVAGIPESSRKAFNALRAAARQAAPKKAKEAISYGIPALRMKKVLVWYAAFTQHCSLFPTGSVLDQFKNELKGYKVSKGTVQFPLDKAVPSALVKKMVRARVAEAGAKRK
jgi:uncharacterized protein YdhG (YjbR/CyaY superfamily)